MKDNDNTQLSGLSIGMCLGLSIGTAIGAATDNIGLWMAVGLSIGMCLGIALGQSNKEVDSEDDNKEEDCRNGGNDEKK